LLTVSSASFSMIILRWPDWPSDERIWAG